MAVTGRPELEVRVPCAYHQMPGLPRSKARAYQSLPAGPAAYRRILVQLAGYPCGEKNLPGRIV